MEGKTFLSLEFDEVNNRRKDGCKSWTCINIFNKRKTPLSNYKRMTTNNAISSSIYTSNDSTTTTTSRNTNNVVESFCQLWSFKTPECHQNMFGSKKILLPTDNEEDEEEKRGPMELTLAQHLNISKRAYIKNKNSWGWLVKGKSEANRQFKIELEENIIWNKEFHDHLQQVAHNKTDQHNAILSLTRLASAACFKPTTASSKPLLIRGPSNQMTGPNGSISKHRLLDGARIQCDPEGLRSGMEVFVLMSSGKPELKWVTVYRKNKQLILSFRKKYMSGIITAMKEYKIFTIVVVNHATTEGYSKLCLKTSDGIIKLLFRDEKQKMIWASTISNLMQFQDF